MNRLDFFWAAWYTFHQEFMQKQKNTRMTRPESASELLPLSPLAGTIFN